LGKEVDLPLHPAITANISPQSTCACPTSSQRTSLAAAGGTFALSPLRSWSGRYSCA